MRWTVLSSDALIFFPAVLYFIFVYYNQPSRSRKSDIGWHTAMLLLNPCLILIDHGHFQVSKINSGNFSWFIFLFCFHIFSCFLMVHCFKSCPFLFQYNCISLGLTIGAVAAILADEDLFASVLYCLALNHKQVNFHHHCVDLLFSNFGTFVYSTWSYMAAQSCPGGMVI